MTLQTIKNKSSTITQVDENIDMAYEMSKGQEGEN